MSDENGLVVLARDALTLEVQGAEEVIASLQTEFVDKSRGHRVYSDQGTPITNPADYVREAIEGCGVLRRLREGDIAASLQFDPNVTSINDVWKIADQYESPVLAPFLK